MRLDILDRGHRLHTKAVMTLIRVFSGHPVVDAVKLAFYRPHFYGGGPLTHEAMRGQSDWSVGDRELMAAYVSKANECPFCVSAHSATSTMWYADDAKVAATLADLETAPIEEPLRATLRMLGKLTHKSGIEVDDVRAVLASSVSVGADQGRPGGIPRLQHHRPAGQRIWLHHPKSGSHERGRPFPPEAWVSVDTATYFVPSVRGALNAT